jgi:hypothetical protein
LRAKIQRGHAAFFLFLEVLFMSVKDSYYLPDDGYFIMEYPSLGIRTVALTLGHICRFAGDVKTFWPVLMHALVVSYLVPEPVAIHALLHDAGEIYIGDEREVSMLSVELAMELID